MVLFFFIATYIFFSFSSEPEHLPPSRVVVLSITLSCALSFYFFSFTFIRDIEEKRFLCAIGVINAFPRRCSCAFLPVSAGFSFSLPLLSPFFFKCARHSLIYLCATFIFLSLLSASFFLCVCVCCHRCFFSSCAFLRAVTGHLFLFFLLFTTARLPSSPSLVVDVGTYLCVSLFFSFSLSPLSLLLRVFFSS